MASRDGEENKMIALGKDLFNAQQRILDHRVFVNGEIDSFLNEFEAKRNEAEVETLFKVTETTGDLKYELSDRCISLGTLQLTQLSASIGQVFAGVQDLLAKAQVEKEPSNFLVESRRERAQKRDNFIKDIEHGYRRVDNSFEEKEEEIAELYSDLQLKLNIPK